MSRTSSPTSPLLISSHEQGVFLLPGAFDDTHPGDASLDFKEIEGQHVLSQIKTPAGVYTIDGSREAKRLTKMANDHTPTTGMTSSGAK
ncbi:MAG TPA: hypothetical protein VG498_05940 [Terriglobales bacterium]|nr:hypothetical protein [Terriglobales bacterium]